jgi:hypothetical protein
MIRLKYPSVGDFSFYVPRDVMILEKKAISTYEILLLSNCFEKKKPYHWPASKLG